MHLKKLIGYFKMDFSDRRVFFSINSGRSGSQYLAELLGTAEEVTSFHEAEPFMNEEYLHLVNQFSYPDTIKKRRLKAKAIKKILRGLPPDQIYCETNHMFIKTFFDVIAEEFQNLEVIILRRELAFVLKSFIELGYFSDKNSAWADWMTNPNAKTAALPCISSDDRLDQYDLCIAYLFDIEARALRFQKAYPLVKTHQVRLESLNDYFNVESLFRDLKITMTDKTKSFLGRKTNTREKAKNNYDNPSDLEYCRKRIEIYIEKALSSGIVLPDTLALGEYKNQYGE
jgi:hypothetical protein